MNGLQELSFRIKLAIPVGKIISEVNMNPSSENVEKGTAILQEHDQWLAEHLDELIDQYPGKVVAILDGEVVGVGDSYKEVYAPFQNQGRDWMPLAIRVPHPDDTQEFLL